MRVGGRREEGGREEDGGIIIFESSFKTSSES